MSIDATGRGHNDKGVPGAGQFNGHVRPAAGTDVDLRTPYEGTATASALAETIRTLDPREIPDLVYVAYDDKLTDEQIDAYLSGDFDALTDSTDEWVSDQQYEAATEFLRSFLDDRGADWDDLSDDDHDELRQAVYDRDRSDPIRHLLRNTHDQLLRAPLRSPADLIVPDADGEWPDGIDARFYNDTHWDAIRERRVAALQEALASHNVTVTAEVRQALEELVVEGPADWHDGVSLDVIWYGDVAEAGLAGADRGEAAGRTLSFENAEVVLIDRVNGSGYSARIPGTLTTTVTDDAPAFLDSARSGNHGYGWDDVAGVVKPYFRPDTVASTWQAPAAVAA
ncbi:hypothetical protein [Curtobacterium sp. MCBD17_040]|uniref:hypothetical protein n=1 Tax=Curtobacterium sp. MCBD17_040 TaxID=2175674 RepID=UPI0011B5CA84|nr:hypothetical protein [Curtobacterium sp. MCBD17_040]WIB65318.1 hypothetical protein DEI94_18095 [Curtobacterium sp. MCBD17_040]